MTKRKEFIVVEYIDKNTYVTVQDFASMAECEAFILGDNGRRTLAIAQGGETNG